MDRTYINTLYRKNKHLTLADREFIQYHCMEYSKKTLAHLLGRSLRTIEREWKRGAVRKIIHGRSVQVYCAMTAHAHYMQSRKNCHRNPSICEPVRKFIQENLKRKKYSPEVIVALLRKRNQSISKSTIYYHQKKNPSLFQFTWKDAIYQRRYQSKKEVKPSLRLTGKSIEMRSQAILTREEFGHWEMDTVVSGKETSKSALLVLTERKTRYELIFKMKDKTAKSVETVLDSIEMGIGIDKFRNLFKTITVDNGSEFINAFLLEQSISGNGQRTSVFYCHPYSSYERGSNENNNRFIRRFIPKGADISKYDEAEIYAIQQYMNQYPRKTIQYRNAEDLFYEYSTLKF